MLLSVEETAKILEVKPGHLWYLLRFGRIDGAVKICSNWRIDEYSAKEMYEQINAKRAGILPGYSKYLGFNELLENIRKTSLSSAKKSPFTRVQSRRRVEHKQKRPDSVDRKSGRTVVHLELWTDNQYW